MNRNLRLFSLAAAASAVLTSCQIKPLEQWPTTLRISGEVVTWAGETGWGDANIGVRAVSPAEGAYCSSCLNVRYSAVTTGVTLTDFTAVGDEIQFGENDASVTFTAYAPYEATASVSDLPGTNGVISRSTLDQSERTAIDFLFAGQRTAGFDSPELTFSFSHEMVQLVFYVAAGDGFTDEDVDGGAYSLDGLILDGSFNSGTGAAAASSPVETLPISGNCPSATIEGEGISYTAVIYPQSFDSLTFSGRVGSITRSVDLVEGTGVDGFEAGNTYTYRMSVSEYEMTLTGCSITDWTSGDTWNVGVNPGKH